MNRDYQIISKNNSGELAKFLSKEGQLLLPMLELIEQAEAGKQLEWRQDGIVLCDGCVFRD